jgi:TonB family protein
MSSAMFRTLESSRESRIRRSFAMIGGVLVQVGMIGIAIFLGILFPDELPLSARQSVMVFLPSLIPPPARVADPPRRVIRVLIPNLQSPVTPATPFFAATDLELPKMRLTAPPVLASFPQALLPGPPLAQSNPAPKVQKAQVEVRTGTFAAAPGPATTKRPAEQVQTGGFGSPQGFRGKAQGESAGNVPRLGSLGFPQGPGVGNGTGGAHGIQGVVASAGFGSAVAVAATTRATGYASGGGGTGVALGGFEKVGQVAQFPMKSLPAPQPTEFQPVEILAKPSPVYTEEARRLGIQGEVTLSVVFQASGAIRILEVVKSLGHGLDQAAQQAASQIRFKPARQNGKPADFPANLRIEFRLADQST